MLEIIEKHICHGGVRRFYRHESKTIGLPMRFSVYLPPKAQHGRVPALFYLAGLTCPEETFPMKAGAPTPLPPGMAWRSSRRIRAHAGRALRAKPMRGTSAPGPAFTSMRRASR